jgi:hypothetical protein
MYQAAELTSRGAAVTRILQDAGYLHWEDIAFGAGFAVAESQERREVLVETRHAHYGKRICDYTDAKRQRDADLLVAYAAAICGAGCHCFIEDRYLVAPFSDVDLAVRDMAEKNGEG